MKFIALRQMKVAYKWTNEFDCNVTNEIAYKWTNKYCLKRDKVKFLTRRQMKFAYKRQIKLLITEHIKVAYK